MKSKFKKQALALVTVMALVISIFSISSIGVSADTDFTQQEAENLFIDALNRVANLYITDLEGYPINLNYVEMLPIYHHTGTVFGYFPKNSIQTQYMVGNIKDFGIYYFDKSTDGTPYSLPEVYNRVTDERFNTMEKISDYLTEVFTYQAAQCALKINGIETFRPSEGGMEQTVAGTQTESLPGYVAISINFIGIPNVVNIGELKVNGNTATLNVVREKYESIDSNHSRKYEKTETVEFKKTEAGWRISGGGYFTSIFGVFETPDVEYTADAKNGTVAVATNPKTGSTALIYIAFSMLSLSVACVALTKKKRK